MIETLTSPDPTHAAGRSPVFAQADKPKGRGKRAEAKLEDANRPSTRDTEARKLAAAKQVKLNKLGLELPEESNQVMHDNKLTINFIASTNTIHRNLKIGCNHLSRFSRHTFK